MMEKLIGECLSSLNPSDDIFCPAHFDGLLCWPATPPGTVATLQCPSGSRFDPERQAKVHCLANGQWSTRHDYGDCLIQQSKKSDVMDGITTVEPKPAVFENENLRMVLLALDGASIGFLVVGTLLWAMVWYKSLFFRMYRLVLFVSLVVASVIGHTTSIVFRASPTTDVTNCRIATAFATLSNLVLYSLLLATALLNVIMWKNQIRLNYYRLIFPFFLVLLIPLLCVFAQVISETFYSSDNCHYDIAYADSQIMWISHGAKLVFLGLSLFITFSLVIMVVCGKHQGRHTPGESLFHRHSNSLLLCFLIYCTVYEVAAIVWSNIDTHLSFDLNPYTEGCRSAKGIALGILLFFFDLDIIKRIPYAAKCCPCLKDDSENWEARPLNEVSFNEQAKDDDVEKFRTTATLNLTPRTRKSDRSGIENLGHNTYGALQAEK